MEPGDLTVPPGGGLVPRRHVRHGSVEEPIEAPQEIRKQHCEFVPFVVLEGREVRHLAVWVDMQLEWPASREGDEGRPRTGSDDTAITVLLSCQQVSTNLAHTAPDRT